MVQGGASFMVFDDIVEFAYPEWEVVTVCIPGMGDSYANL